MLTLKNDSTCSFAPCVVANIKRDLLNCLHHFNSDLINNMDHMRISVIEPSRQRYINIYKLHWDGVGSNFYVEN